MSYDVYRLIFIGAAIACGIMFVISVILFFVFKIPNIIGVLTGRNAKKAIEGIKKQNEAYAIKQDIAKNDVKNGKKITQKISTAKLSHEEETTVLNYTGAEETTTLNYTGSEETTILNHMGTEQTDVLNYAGTEETSVLSQNEIQSSDMSYSNDRFATQISSAFTFAVIDQIVFIHTHEQI